MPTQSPITSEVLLPFKRVMSGILLPFHRVVHDSQADLFLNRIAQQAMSRTRATGSAIALSDGDAVTCWARAGLTSPQLGAKIDARSGLCARSMSTGKILVCDDAETDSRADQEACCQLAVKSIATVPLHGNDRVIGVGGVLTPTPRL